MSCYLYHLVYFTAQAVIFPRIVEKIGKDKAKRLWDEPCGSLRSNILKSTRQAREKLSKLQKGSLTVELTVGQEMEIVLSVDEVRKANETMVDAGKIRYCNNTQQESSVFTQ